MSRGVNRGSRGPREYTNKIAEMVDNHVLDKDRLIEDLLCWMSEHDVKEFYMANVAPEFPEDEDEE
jgi:hypothetical protein